MDEEYVRAESSVTYSATLSNQAANKDDPYNVIYTAPCGMQGMHPTNSERQERLIDTIIVPAVFHDQIRAELIAIAKKDGEYGMLPLSILIFKC